MTASRRSCAQCVYGCDACRFGFRPTEKSRDRREYARLQAKLRLGPADCITSCMRIEIYEDASRQWRWRAVDGNNRIIADGAEGYITRSNAERGLDNVINEFRSTIDVVTRKQPRALTTPEYDTLATYDAEGQRH